MNFSGLLNIFNCTSKRLVLLFVALLFSLGVAMTTTSIKCPTCGVTRFSKSILANDQLAGTSSLECRRIMNDVAKKTSLPSFKCRCKYANVHENECASNLIADSNDYDMKHLNQTIVEQMDLKEEPSMVSGDCLVAYVGMAIRGYNMLHRKWISKENCMNLCLNTRAKNGFAFDCTSFEHWHRDCKSQIFDAANDPLCASFQDESNQKSAEHRTRKSKKLTTITSNGVYQKSFATKSHTKKTRTTKMDICVLSNQTIDIAGKDFSPNNAVTYYEILCKGIFICLIDSTR